MTDTNAPQPPNDPDTAAGQDMLGAADPSTQAAMPQADQQPQDGGVQNAPSASQAAPQNAGGQQAQPAQQDAGANRGQGDPGYQGQSGGGQTIGATPDSDADGNNALQRDPQEWATGDEPMTAAQKSYLDTLAKEAGEQLPANLTKAEASQHIDRLQGQSNRVN